MMTKKIFSTKTYVMNLNHFQNDQNFFKSETSDFISPNLSKMCLGQTEKFSLIVDEFS